MDFINLYLVTAHYRKKFKKMFEEEKIVTIECKASRSKINKKDFRIFVNKNLEEFSDTFNAIF